MAYGAQAGGAVQAAEVPFLVGQDDQDQRTVLCELGVAGRVGDTHASGEDHGVWSCGKTDAGVRPEECLFINAGLSQGLSKTC